MQTSLQGSCTGTPHNTIHKDILSRNSQRMGAQCKVKLCSHGSTSSHNEWRGPADPPVWALKIASVPSLTSENSEMEMAAMATTDSEVLQDSRNRIVLRMVDR